MCFLEVVPVTGLGAACGVAVDPACVVELEAGRRAQQSTQFRHAQPALEDQAQAAGEREIGIHGIDEAAVGLGLCEVCIHQHGADDCAGQV
ncbi:hypothetical protein, partial [Brevibacterium salitolerans]|uniref:hypothetical protein n=1 Tax=Brevibacterium salitolerans TaxID=1403566 RepID=UPI0031E43923